MRILKKTLPIAAYGAGLIGLQNVSADTEIVNTRLGSGDGDTETVGGTSQKEIAELNEIIDNLQREFTFVKIAGTGNVTKAELLAKQKEFKQIEIRLNRIKSLTQTAIANGIEVGEGNKVSTLSELKDEYDKLRAEINTQTLSPQAYQILAELIKDANAQIVNAKKALVSHGKDGILGNLDDIKRASDDSKKDIITSNKKEIGTDGKPTGKTLTNKKPGVVVNNEQTQRVNTVTETENNLGEINVQDPQDLAQERDQILAKIKDAATSNTNEVLRAKTYRDNSLANIDAINKWLQKEQDRADNIQSEIEKNSTSLNMMKEYKTSQIAELEKAKKLIQDSKKSDQLKKKMIAQIDEEIKKIQNSDVKMKITDKITAAENLDFGDIGRDKKVIEGVMNDATKKIDGAVNEAIKKLESSNSKANSQIAPTINKNKEAIKKYLEQVSKGGGGGQIDEAWLSRRPIYSSPDYKKYVNEALRQTEATIDGVFIKEELLEPHYKDMTLKYTNPGKTIANIAAVQWAADSNKGLDGAYGSVMVPSANINDFVTVRGSKFANSQTFAGGAQGILDKIGERAWDSPTHRYDIYKEAVFKDIRDQHIKTVGNSNVFLVASYSPTATFDLKDSYVTVDKDGNVKTYPLSLTVNIQSFSGGAIPNKNLAGENPKIMYLYYLSVDPKTGKVLVGAGYYRHATKATTSGNVGGGSGGELRLGLDTSSTDDSSTLAGIGRGLLSPVDYRGVGDPLDNAGIFTTFDARLPEETGEGGKGTPIYISDIDDGQSLYVYKNTNNTHTNIILSGAGSPAIRDFGTYYALDTHVPKSNGITSGAILDEYSAMITGQSSVGIGHGGRYQSIDVSLFNPWGIIGTPKIKLDQVNTEIETFEMSSPSAKAHTEGSYNLKQVSGSLVVNPRNGSNRVSVPTFETTIARPTEGPKTEKKTGSNTSLIVRKILDNVKISGSGNSLVVRETKGNRSGSGNSMIVRVIEKEKRSGSGNSLVVRTTEPVARLSGSGNTLVVRPVGQALTINKNTVKTTVYVDPSLKGVADRALTAWKDALSKHGVDLEVKYDKLQKGVGIAILDADNVTTRLDRTQDTLNVANDSDFEMNKLGGLTISSATMDFVNVDRDDKLTKDRTVDEASLLKNAKYIVQINTEAVKDSTEIEKVLKHELGHVFGLAHDNNDSLMTTYYSDPIFTGVISDKDASLAAENIRSGKFCDCATCTKARTEPKPVVTKTHDLREYRNNLINQLRNI